MDIFAGAAHCDVTKGRFVGQVVVELLGNGTISSVLITTSGNPLFFSSLSMYAGSRPLPVDRRGAYVTAPGQFPIQYAFSEYPESFDATSLFANRVYTSPVYFVMHMNMCGIVIA
jgi:hypothetical protein